MMSLENKIAATLNIPIHYFISILISSFFHFLDFCRPHFFPACTKTMPHVLSKLPRYLKQARHLSWSLLFGLHAENQKELVHHMLIENEHICVNICKAFSLKRRRKIYQICTHYMLRTFPALACWRSIILSTNPPCTSDTYKSEPHSWMQAII